MAGALLGVILIMGYVQVSGGWYIYTTQDKWNCEVQPLALEIVPNQPNPCHYRRPRWRWLY